MGLISSLRLIYNYQFKHDDTLKQYKYEFSSQFVKNSDIQTLDFLIKEGNERMKSLYDGFATINNRAYMLLSIVFTISIGVIGADVVFNNLKDNMLLVSLFYIFGFAETLLLLILINPKGILFPGISPELYDNEWIFGKGEYEKRAKLQRINSLNKDIKKMTDVQIVRSAILRYAISLFWIFLIVYPVVLYISSRLS